MSYAIFGDIHGDSKRLRELINIVKDKYPDISFYAAGDLIDRGLDSKGVIDLCIEHNIKSVCGNHDLWLKTIFTDNLFDRFALEPVMGGRATFSSYGINTNKIYANNFEDMQLIPSNHIEYYKSMPKYILIDEKYLLLHSPITEDKYFSLKNKYGFKEERELLDIIDQMSFDDAALHIMWPSPKNDFSNVFRFQNFIQVFGHKPTNNVKISEHYIALDTGCSTCKPNLLSCIVLPENEVYFVAR